jgi:hypothetical protein
MFTTVNEAARIRPTRSARELSWSSRAKRVLFLGMFVAGFFQRERHNQTTTDGKDKTTRPGMRERAIEGKLVSFGARAVPASDSEGSADNRSL